MANQHTRVSIAERVEQLRERYDHPSLCAASILCDSHDPQSVAFRFVRADLSTHDLTYKDLKIASEQFAHVLRRLRVQPGDRVATLMGKGRDYVIALMGIWRMGAVHVPLFTAFAPAAIEMRLVGSKAKVVICDARQRDKLAAIKGDSNAPPFKVVVTAEAGADEYSWKNLMGCSPAGFRSVPVGSGGAFINIYTSGTTGTPKGVTVPLRALAAFHAYAEFALDLRKDEDVFWCSADPGWAYGLYFGILATLLTGVPSILFEGGFSAEATMGILAQEGVTNFSAAPTVYRSLAAASITPSRPLKLRCASSAGEPLTEDVNVWAHSTLGVTVHDHYGQTEAGMLINNHHHPDLAKAPKPGSMGQSMPGWRAAVLHAEHDEEVGSDIVGRVAMRVADSPLAWFEGYDSLPEASAEKFTADGTWYLTGDTGKMDGEGNFTFCARDDDVIIMAGYRIGPHEVEAALQSHPAVQDCAVIAVPDAVRGEVVEAFVVLAPGYVENDGLLREMQSWVKTHYAAHAYPRRIHIAEDLPRTPSGKLQRKVLKTRRCEDMLREQQA